jgi:hypothetical protein
MFVAFLFSSCDNELQIDGIDSLNNPSSETDQATNDSFDTVIISEEFDCTEDPLSSLTLPGTYFVDTDGVEGTCTIFSGMVNYDPFDTDFTATDVCVILTNVTRCTQDIVEITYDYSDPGVPFYTVVRTYPVCSSR